MGNPSPDTPSPDVQTPPGSGTPPPPSGSLFSWGGIIGAAVAGVASFMFLPSLTGGFSSITSSLLTGGAIAAVAAGGLIAGNYAQSWFTPKDTQADAKPPGSTMANPIKDPATRTTMLVPEQFRPGVTPPAGDKEKQPARYS